MVLGFWGRLLSMICCGFVVARNIFLLLFSVKREEFIEFCAFFYVCGF